MYISVLIVLFLVPVSNYIEFSFSSCESWLLLSDRGKEVERQHGHGGRGKSRGH